MQRTRWIYLALIVALITIIAVPLYLYNRPLGPSLELKPQPAAAAAAASSVSDPAQGQPAKIVQPIVQRQSSDNTCGGSGLVNMLYLGQNLPETTNRGADLIRLIMVNYDTPALAILAMPPDLFVTTNELDDVEGTTLTMAFWYGKQPPPHGEPAALKRATEVVAQALVDNFAYTTEKYMTMNQPVFGEMVDTMGGITVMVGETVDGSPEGYGIYYAGEDFMDGQRALDYVRMLQPKGQPPDEWARFNRQNEVIVGIVNAIQNPGNWLKLPSLIGDFYNLFVTDLKPKELESIYCMINEEDTELLNQEITEEYLLEYTPGDEVMFPNNGYVEELIVAMQEWTETLEWVPPTPPPPESE